MKTTNKLVLTSLLASILVGCGNGSTGSGGDNPTPPPPSAVSVGVSTPGKLFGIDTSSSATGSSVQALDGGAIAYYVPIANTSSSSLTISSATVTNIAGSAAFSTDLNTCANAVPAGQSCNIAVGFNGSNVNSAEALNGIVSVTYSNGTVSEIPVAGNIVESGSLDVELPSVIAPNSNGYAYGVITVFNGTSDTQSITASDIAPEAQEGVTWTFTPNCDGNGGSTIAPLKACSVGFVYQVDTSIEQPATPAPISVAVPVVNTVTGQTTVAQPVAASLPPASTTTPRAYLSYNGGVVSLTGSTASFTISNVGNGVLSMINVTGLVSGVTQTNTCNNVSANGVCTVTLTKAAGTTLPADTTITVEGIGSTTGVNSVNVSVAGQQLAVSPTTLDFGQNFGGATQQRSVTISNTGTTSLTLSQSFITGNSAYNEVSSNCSATLARFASCQTTIGYTAPNSTASQTATYSIGAAGQQPVSVALRAISTATSWNNLIANATNYTDSKTASIISLITVDDGLLFGNSMPQGVAGARNIWAIDTTDNNAFELQALTGMDTSAPTAIAYNSGALNAFIGKYDGTFYKCNANTDACTSIGAANPSGFGITSVVQIDDTHALASLSDKSTGTTGALWYYNGSSSQALNINGAAAGKMAQSGTTIFVPTHAVNQTGQVVLVNSATGAITSTLAVNGFVTGSGEYFTVLYVDNGVIYGGTNLGNVYASPVATLSATSWTKLTSTRLSTSSVVTSLAVLNGELYAGLGKLGSSAISGGSLYKQSGSSFVKATGYSDTSSISAMAVNGNSLYVGTYGGNIWQLAQ